MEPPERMEPVEPINILLVDDRPSNLIALKAILERPEYNLVLAASGEEALKWVLREEFALILMDVAMPRLDGLETAMMLKGRQRSRHIPILFVTASVHDVESVTRAYQSGAVDYLHKPVEPYLVKAKVEVFVELFRQRREIERQAALLRESAIREQEYELRRREAERWRYLDEASSRLLVSLDADVTLKALGEITVPRLADGCAVYAGATGMRLLEVRHAERPERAGQLASPSPLQGLDPERVERVCVEGVSERAADGRLLIVPLNARGHVQGAMALMRHPHSPSFSDGDLAVAEELGRRAAIATDNARLYAEARAAVQLRDEFLSIAAHELRTPLTTLRLGLQSLSRDAAVRAIGEEGMVARRLRQSLRSTDRLTSLVDHLLDVSRVVSGRLQLQREPLDLAQLASEMVERFREEAARVGTELRLIASEPVCGAWDRLRLEQVMDNLLTNALKYAPGKPVEVTVSGGEGWAHFVVRDHGIGIAQEDVDRIFGRFERAVPLDHYGGLGLGLYLVQQFVHAHEGRIRVQTAKGEGSTFTVELPMVAEPAEAAPA